LILQASYLAGIQQLTQLVSLKISKHWSYLWGVDQLQPLQQLLQVHLDVAGLPAIDVSHLTQLQSLVLYERLPEGWLLPLQLTALSLGSCYSDIDVAPLLKLQPLERLLFEVVAFDSAPQLLQLTKGLPGLQRPSLVYCGSGDAACAAEAWPHLTALQELTNEYEDSLPTPTQWGCILQGVAASTRLTQLHLAAIMSEVEDERPEDEGVAVAACACLADLKTKQRACGSCA
jgi:hypothetical protein